MHLRDSHDAAPALGVAPLQEVRFARCMPTSPASPSCGSSPANARQSLTATGRGARRSYVILSGAGRIKLDDDVRDVRPLDAIRVAPGVARAVEGGPDGIEYLAFGPATRATERPSRSTSWTPRSLWRAGGPDAADPAETNVADVDELTLARRVVDALAPR